MSTHRPARKRPFDPRDLKDLAEHLSLLSQVGLTMAAAVGIGLALGIYLDRWTGHVALWKALCIPLGVLSGFWAVYRLIVDTEQRSERRRR
ncbi:MAG: hypothetical protein Kow0092_39750 [Deferrisomatales bacterium]